MCGDDVKALQKQLGAVGKIKPTIDGRFGKHTEAAVKAFQLRYQLTVDGVVGDKTRAALAKATAKT